LLTRHQRARSRQDCPLNSVVATSLWAQHPIAAGLESGSPRRGALTQRDRPLPEHIRSWIGQLPGPGAVAYEAGPTGFGLSRSFNGSGIRCEVVAPSKLQRPSGDRVKTHAKDAVHLARLLRLDEITPVVVPTVEQEAARDLVRAREDARGDLMRARHRLSKLLLPPRTGVLRRPRLDRQARCLAASGRPGPTRARPRDDPDDLRV
jgi:transposase